MEKAIVRNGIDNIAKYSELFAGKRVGLITGPTGVNKQLKSTIDIFAEMFNLTTLYAPEHGIRGERQAGATVETYQDERTGLTVYSLYGMNKKPSSEMLANVDILAIDIQDVGIRYYTYL
ncbi:MAG TPA: exo-beta-N-acetylmuramidase NamZ domain-containing protein, partial [Bacillota bacterium]